jgi:predicted dehydrogenase
VNIGIVGCGNIAARYATTIGASPGLELVAATDVLPGRAEELAASFGGVAHETLEELLADGDVELVVNLTAPQVHADVTRAALEAGRHVYSEKPLALRHDEARALVELAAARGLLLGGAPSTLLGEAQQTAWKLVREGAIGTVRIAYAEANWGRLETWHPSPQSLYGVGAFVDVGVYPLTIVTAMFGPARRVSAFGTVVMPERTLGSGETFRLEAPDFVVAAIELERGVVVRLTATFYVMPSKQRGLELHGDDGRLYMAAWDAANSRLELATGGGDYEPVELVREPYDGIDWSRALVDLAEAARDGRAPRANGEHAAHVVEILDAIRTSAADGRPVEVHSSFTPPPPLEWGT